MSELGLIETETLVKELMNRFDAIVIMGIQKSPEASKKGQDFYYHNYCGGLATCLGLAGILYQKIMKQYMDEPKEV